MSKLVKSTLIILIGLVLIISFIPTKPILAVNIEQRAVTTLQNNTVYKIRNKETGKYLNVNYGTDANGTNVTQFTGDGSIEQKWKAVKNSDGSWKFYAMCSSNGNNRVLDVLRDNGSASQGISYGNNIDIWAPNDAEAQNWIVVYQPAYGAFYIWLAVSDYNMLVASYGTGNGSGSGTSNTSNGNVFITDIYNLNENQHFLWEFIEV